MNIKKGHFYENKTKRFLFPSLRGHGNVFVKKFSKVHKLAVGIHDSILDGSDLSNERTILVMLDKTYVPKIYQEFMSWLQYQPYYKGTYCPDPDFRTSFKQIIVLNIPELFYNAYDSFLEGKYSNMYSKDEVDSLFITKLNKENAKRDYGILTKSQEAYNKFFEKNKEIFNAKKLEKSTFQPDDYEFPLVMKEEIFNYNKGERTFFNTELDKVWST